MINNNLNNSWESSDGYEDESGNIYQDEENYEDESSEYYENEEDEYIPIKFLPNEWIVDYENPLGHGKFSDVYFAKKLDGFIDGEEIKNGECVIKIIKGENIKIGLNEINIIKTLLKESFNPNIVKFYGYSIEFGKEQEIEKIYIYMEYLKGFKSIGDILKKDKFEFSEHQIAYITGQVHSSLKFINSIDIIHRDIKCDNILLNLENGEIKLIDFGISKLLLEETSQEHQQHTITGTPSHMAPEIAFGEFSEKLDVWSLGCTIIEMAGGNLSQRSQKGIPIIPSHLSNEFKNYIQQCLIVDSNDRPNLYHLLCSVEKNYWINSQLSTFNESIKKKSIPKSIKVLALPSFNQVILPDTIPKTVESLILPLYNHPIEPNSIPLTVKSIDFPSFNHSLKIGSIPSSIKTLKLNSFNQKILPSSIPESVDNLRLKSFNHRLLQNSIPLSVHTLLLESFNHPIEPNTIPNRVAVIKLSSFNHSIKVGSIPESVTLLELSSFDQVIEPNSLPSSIRYLELLSFNQKLQSKSIPSSVQTLILPSFNHEIGINLIPSSVVQLELLSYNHRILPDSIPSSVQSLILSKFNQNLDEDSIPTSLSSLEFGENFEFNKYGGNIPSNIKSFSCSYNFKSKLKKNNNIPKKVKELVLSNYNHEIVKDSIPETVTTLELGSNFTHFDSFKYLPSSVINLSFGVNRECNLSDEEIKEKLPKQISDVMIYRENIDSNIKIKFFKNKLKY